MSVKYIKTRIKPARGTAEVLKARNPTLLDGEMIFENDTGKCKRGDGSTKWNDLPYWTGGTPRCIVSVQNPESEIWIDVDMETVSIGKEADAYVDIT